MSLFAIADTHLSFGTDKPMDSFPGWNDYVDRIEKNWNKIVTDDDTVVIAGDISWAINFDELKADFDFIERLNGKKIILKGNHDYWWNTSKKMNDFIESQRYKLRRWLMFMWIYPMMQTVYRFAVAGDGFLMLMMNTMKRYLTVR